MSKHTAVRIKGSRWEAVAHNPRPSHLVDMAYRPSTPDQARRQSVAPGAHEDLLLDLAVRHFDELDLTVGDAREIATAILQVVARGGSVCVFLAGRTEHAYELTRRVTAVDIRFGQARMRLPLYAAIQLADLLQRRGNTVERTGIAA